MEGRACRVLKQAALDVHVGDVDDANRRKPGVAGGHVRERHLAALEDKDPKRAGAVVTVDKDLLTELAGTLERPKLELLLSGIDIVLGR